MIEKIHIAIISHNRPENVVKMEKLTGLGDKLNWYVGLEEKKAYKHAQGEVCPSGNLVNSRNKALDIAYAERKYCFMLDDDLMYINHFRHDKSSHRIGFKLLLKEMCEVLDSTPMELAGCSPTGNAFWYDPTKPLSTKHFIIASCQLTKYDCRLRFDPQFKLKEDYDYTLQHIKKFGGVCRLNYLAPKFQHYLNKGGAVDVRTEDLETKMIGLLKKKWKGSIRLNPRRKNEILLRVG